MFRFITDMIKVVVYVQRQKIMKIEYERKIKAEKNMEHDIQVKIDSDINFSYTYSLKFGKLKMLYERYLCLKVCIEF